MSRVTSSKLLGSPFIFVAKKIIGCGAAGVRLVIFPHPERMFSIGIFIHVRATSVLVSLCSDTFILRYISNTPAQFRIN